MLGKKSDEQEWSRFRGALAKDREDVSATPAAAEPAPPPAPPSTSAGAVTVPPSPGGGRSGPGDVNVTVPSRRPMSSLDGDVDSLIGEHTTFEGTLKATGAVRVLGTVQGEIESKGSILVDEKAQVSAKISAAQVVIAGRVEGQIFSQGRVEIRPTGRVTGEIQAATLIVQEGAFFDGTSKMAHSPT